MPVAPPAPSWRMLLAEWQPDVLFVVVLGAAVAYLAATRRLARRGRCWPRGRTISFGLGLGVVLVATESGLAAYDRVLFSLHVVQHLLLGLVAPVLLVLGAPATLALQASSRATRRRLLRVLHGRVARVLAHPLVAWVLFGGTLVVLYFTPLYEASLRHGWVHELVHVHFLVAGVLFAWCLVGVDPAPRRVSHGGRIFAAFFALPFHTFVAVAVLSSDQVIAADWYTALARPWGASPLADQRLGAGILWIAGELLGVLALGLALAQWMRHEERAGRRFDRAADAAGSRRVATAT